MTFVLETATSGKNFLTEQIQQPYQNSNRMEGMILILPTAKQRKKNTDNLGKEKGKTTITVGRAEGEKKSLPLHRFPTESLREAHWWVFAQ